ncbi:MAG TPA: transglutaminase domain-containing protein [Gemmatimonadales bacterium]|nr:transglutaminase domain-containing protein [Gemmatimonadales bacterium]
MDALIQPRARRSARRHGTSSPTRGGPAGVALVLAAVLLAGACQGSASTPRARPSSGEVTLAPGTRGPGLRKQPLHQLPYPVARSFDLSHVTPAAFAAALGRDPVRLFEFVRDQVAYEAYPGVLRGPRGTLLARAGNAADRALLLAALLREAGQEVRFVRGRLPDAEARALLASMWAPRSTPAVAAAGGSSTDLRRIVDGIMPTVVREYASIREELRNAPPAQPIGGPPLSALLEEAADHAWVQWQRDGRWVDLDPSFPEAGVGRTFARSAETLSELPETLYHRIAIHVRVEEYAGATSAVREVLRYEAKSADLAAADVVLTHWPENWKGPVEDLGSGIAAALESTGRVKPALLIGPDVVMGEPFRQRVPSGLGGLPSMLSGEGTRRDTPLATAEWLEVRLTGPSGAAGAVRRDLFDTIGRAGRRAGLALSAEEARVRAEGGPDVTHGVYSLFFTAGALDHAHLERIPSRPVDPDEPGDLLMALRRFSILFTTVIDGLMPQLSRDRSVITFYPDSPRLTIAEFWPQPGVGRLSLDLRRTDVRAAATNVDPQEVVRARILRGVVEGAVEEALIDYVTTDLRREQDGWGALLSTTALLRRARDARVRMLLLPRDSGRLDRGLPEETKARLQDEADGAFIAVVPEKPVVMDGRPRLAWWRVAPGSGQTVAVTDEGLHQVVVEYQIERSKTTNRARMVYREVVNGVGRPWRRTRWFNPGSRAWDQVLRDFMQGMPGAHQLPTIWVP